jgi:hypothetical protein
MCRLLLVAEHGNRVGDHRDQTSDHMAETVALAVLENLVHMSRQDFPNGYVCVAAVLPDGINIMTERDLRLRADPRHLSPQALGDWWIETKESAALEVASAVVPSEHNYLLKTRHIRSSGRSPRIHRRYFTLIHACFDSPSPMRHNS